MILLIACMLGGWTLLMYVVYERFKATSKYIRIATGNTKTLAKKFALFDADHDGVLSEQELGLFFGSFNQRLSRWQTETMIMQYDFLRDGGLRFDALCAWFYKTPLDAETLAQSHANVAQFTGPLEERLDLNLDNQLTEAEKQAMAEMGIQADTLQGSMLATMFYGGDGGSEQQATAGK